jgi:hypothetical protein
MSTTPVLDGKTGRVQRSELLADSKATHNSIGSKRVVLLIFLDRLAERPADD